MPGHWARENGGAAGAAGAAGCIGAHPDCVPVTPPGLHGEGCFWDGPGKPSCAANAASQTILLRHGGNALPLREASREVTEQSHPAAGALSPAQRIAAPHFQRRRLNALANKRRGIRAARLCTC